MYDAIRLRACDQRIVIKAFSSVNDQDKERQIVKGIVKEAIKEWLDEKFAQFGKWTLTGILASSLALLAYLLVRFGGFQKP